jgi:hypothetical protein
MVDWSGGNSRKANRENCIWLAFGFRQDPEPAYCSPHSRTEATQLIARLLGPFAEGRQGRALVCFDFPYGYPSMFASHLPPLDPPARDQLWHRVWVYLAAHIQDDIGTRPGGRPSNKSNRFEVAKALNKRLSTPGQFGPFWCTDNPAAYPCILKRNHPPPSFARMAWALTN